MSTIVWAYQRLAELQGATGFVECDDALAAQLIADGRAQDPQVGGSALKPIEGSAPRARRVAESPPDTPSPHEDAPPPAPQGDPSDTPESPDEEQHDDDAPAIDEPEQAASAEYDTKVVTPKRRASVSRPKSKSRR